MKKEFNRNDGLFCFAVNLMMADDLTDIIH